MGVRYLGIENYSVDEIAKMADWNFADGTSILGLENACRKMSLHAEAIKLNATQLADLMSHFGASAIIEDNKHFFVLLKADADRFFYATTPFETGWFEMKKLAEFWDGKALLFSKSPIKVQSDYKKLPLAAGFVGFALIGAVGTVYLLRRFVPGRQAVEAISNQDKRELPEVLEVRKF